jgi:thiol-disulfide isomerase/thioredoxin
MTTKRRPPDRRFLPVAAFFLAGLLWTGAMCVESRAASPAGGIQVGNHVPSLILKDLSGRIHDFSWPDEALPATLFFFFEFRSAPGLFGLTALDRLSARAGDFGLHVVAVEASGLDGPQVSEALEKYSTIYPEPAFPVVPDPDRTARRLFGFSRNPATYIVEKHGVAVFHEEGFDERTVEKASVAIVRLLDMPVGVITEAAEGSAAAAGETEGEAGPRVLLYPGDGVPSFTVNDTFGGEHLFDWPSKSEEVTVVFFWDDPCRPCIEEMIFLDQIYRRSVNMGLSLRVLAVEAGGLDAAGAEAVMGKYRRFYPQPAFPIALDGQARLTGIFGRGELPTTFFIDGKGIVVEVHRGFDRERAAEWTRLIERSLPRAQGVLERILE